MKKIFTLIIIACFGSLLKAQTNLVSNSGFEQYTTCPNFGAQWNYCTGWNNINLNTGVGLWGTPDYFNTCATSNVCPPATFSGTCTTQAGNAMMGLVLYNVPYPEYREYLSTQLTSPMLPGYTYTLSFWLSNGTGVISPWTIKNIGVHFSATTLTQSGFNVITTVTPQCEVTSNISTSVWTQYTFTINPTTTWNYLNFGSFRTDASNNPVQTFPNPGGPASSYANYFVDEIKVLAPDETTGIKGNKNEALKNMYPNPVKDFLFLELNAGAYNVSVLNAFGKEVSTFESYAQDNTLKLNVSSLEKGVYFIHVKGESKNVTSKFVKE